MKKILFLLLLIGLGFQAKAQQDYLFTQYMVNPLAYNPAYAGSRDALSALAMYRAQWIGINGAPRTGLFQIHSPVGTSNFNVGLNLLSDRVGLFQFNDVALSGAYRLELGDGNLQFGAQIAMRNYVANLSSANTPQTNNDPTLRPYNETLPNFGFGFYYFNEKWFVGGGIPFFYNHQVDISTNSAIDETYLRHYNLSAGLIRDLTESVKFRPSFLFKYAPHAPAQIDLNAAFVFNDAILVGASLRNLETVGGIIQVFLKNNLYVGYSYDYSLNALTTVNTGSHEIFICYDFKIRGAMVQSPRYF
ncbi:MAG: hypothetical protein DDT42_02044 [candidate division WS2 bacterium]|uniref:Type IX secretion system membrane protein PorP/SprF n=1 Tax=Psychracetigena formicireducens TaxID=2986056 RepID=A0A9E2BIG9_PSYF1|nr:hypothetical protein [Candidatus Psychracetigena formicireducens]